MKRLLLGALLALTACNQQAKDGYTFEKDNKILQTNFSTEVTLLHDQKELDRKSKELGIKIDNVAAFGVVNPVNKTCKIYVISPNANYQPEYLGHELTHCLYGNWHPKQ